MKVEDLVYVKGQDAYAEVQGIQGDKVTVAYITHTAEVSKRDLEEVGRGRLEEDLVRYETSIHESYSDGPATELKEWYYGVGDNTKKPTPTLAQWLVKTTAGLAALPNEELRYKHRATLDGLY